MAPSDVRFFCGAGAREDDREGGYGDGKDDADVLAGCCRRPSGSFRLEERRSTVPV